MSRVIIIGFLGTIFAMSQFFKYCRLLNGRDLEPEESERYRCRAQRWLAASGCLFGVALLAIIVGIILR